MPISQVNLAQSGYKIDGRPVEPIDDVFIGTILEFRIEMYNFKNNVQGIQTVFTVGFTHNDQAETREIVMQHPFLSESEKPYILGLRGAKWRALQSGLNLNMDQTQKLSLFINETEKDEGRKFYRYNFIDTKRKCCKCKTETNVYIITNGSKYLVCPDHQPPLMQDVISVASDQQFLIGMKCPIEIKDKNLKLKIKYPQHRFLDQMGFDYIKAEKEEAKKNPPQEEEAKQAIQIDPNETEAPDDEFGGE